MQYLVQNKVKYWKNIPKSGSNTVIWSSSQNYANCLLSSPFVYHIEDVITAGNNTLFFNYDKQENTNYFNIEYTTIQPPSALIISNLFLSFTCNDIMAINDSDSITITVEFKTDNDTITRNYTYPIKQQFMNTYQIFDYCFVPPSLNKIKVTATSTTPLTLLPPVNLTEKQYMHYSYLTVIQS